MGLTGIRRRIGGELGQSLWRATSRKPFSTQSAAGQKKIIKKKRRKGCRQYLQHLAHVLSVIAKKPANYMQAVPYILGNQPGIFPLSLPLKVFLFPSCPLFLVCPCYDCWNMEHRGQLRKSLKLWSQRLLGGHACHFPEKRFIYQILIRFEWTSPWASW